MTCYIAADHAGYLLKQTIFKKYPDMINLGTNSLDAVDYPDFAYKLADHLEDSPAVGILICGSGIGMCIAANRFHHIRAADCTSVEMVKLAKQHNDVNVLCLGSRLLEESKVLSIVDAFFTTSFTKEERHQHRIAKL